MLYSRAHRHAEVRPEPVTFRSQTQRLSQRSHTSPPNRGHFWQFCRQVNFAVVFRTMALSLLLGIYHPGAVFFSECHLPHHQKATALHLGRFRLLQLLRKQLHTIYRNPVVEKKSLRATGLTSSTADIFVIHWQNAVCHQITTLRHCKDNEHRIILIIMVRKQKCSPVPSKSTG